MAIKAPLHLLLWTGGACLGFVAPGVSAQTAAEPSPVVTVSGACPESNAVRRLLLTILRAPVAGGPIATAAVSDLGDTYVVAVGERVKKYADSARDCADRARVAAAFIALALAPATTPNGQPPPSPTTATPAAVPPPVAPSRDGATPAQPGTGPDLGTLATSAVARWWLRVDVRGALEVAPENGLFAPGAALRIAAGRDAFGVHAVCGWLAPASVSLPGETGSALLERMPCATGPTLRFPGGGRLEVQLDAGVALGAVLASGRGFESTYDSARFELGARIAVDAAMHLGTRRAGFAPIVGLEATYYPMVYALDVMSREGALSHTPHAWVGLTAGICWNAE